MIKTSLQTSKYEAQVFNYPNPKDESEVLERIKDRVNSYEPKMAELRQQFLDNTKYYFGNYIDEDVDLRVGEDNIVVPRAFTNWETLIPIITRNVPEPNLTVIQKNSPDKHSIKDFADMLLFRKKKTSAKLSELLPQYLKSKWLLSKADGGADMQKKMEESFRNLATQKGMIFKLKYNNKYKFLEPIVVSVDDCIFNVDANDETELSFFGHYCTYTISELREKGIDDDKIEDLKKLLPARNQGNGVSDKTIVKILEYWEAETVTLEYDEKLILGTYQNPLYNFKNKEKNHFNYPLIPVIIEADLKQNSGVLSKFTTIEVGKTLLNMMDKRKRQINRNAKLSNGIVVVDGNAGISKDDAVNLGSDTDKTLYMDRGNKSNSKDAISIITARPIDAAIVNDMIHTEEQYDKLTGVNETVRGERTAQETAEGRRLLKESALSRNEVLFRVNERVGQKFYNWVLQSLYISCNEKGEVVYTPSGDTVQEKYITQEMLENSKVLCYVKDGSTIPIDKSTIESQAIERFKLGLYSSRKTLEILGDPDPFGTAKEAFTEKSNPMVLYSNDLSTNKYHPEAIMGIYETLKGEVDVPITMPNDEQTAERYLATYNDYIKGDVIVDEDLPPYSSLDTELQRKIQELVYSQSSMIAEFVAQMRALNPQPQSQMPMPMQGQVPQQGQMPQGQDMQSIMPQEQMPMQDMLSSPAMGQSVPGLDTTPPQGMLPS